MADQPTDGAPEGAAPIDTAAELAKLREQLSSLTAARESDKAAYQQFVEFSKGQRERERAEHKRQLDELRAKRKNAIAAGDGDGFEEADSAIKELEGKAPAEEPPAEAKPAQPAAAKPEDPAVKAWMTSVGWDDEDTDVTAEFYLQAQALRAAGEKSSGTAFLDKVRKRVQRVIPDALKGAAAGDGGGSAPATPAPARGARPAARVEGAVAPAPRGGRGARVTWDTLDAKAQAAADDFIRRGWFKDRDEYLKTYAEQNGATLQ